MSSTEKPLADALIVARRSTLKIDRSAPAPRPPDHLLKEVNLFSICTNDSIPYTLVVDRTYETVAGLDCTADPVVLRFIATVVKVAPSQRQKSVSAA